LVHVAAIAFRLDKKSGLSECQVKACNNSSRRSQLDTPLTAYAGQCTVECLSVYTSMLTVRGVWCGPVAEGKAAAAVAAATGPVLLHRPTGRYGVRTNVRIATVASTSLAA